MVRGARSDLVMMRDWETPFFFGVSGLLDELKW
jgi:hypothetical protein